MSRAGSAGGAARRAARTSQFKQILQRGAPASHVAVHTARVHGACVYPSSRLASPPDSENAANCAQARSRFRTPKEHQSMSSWRPCATPGTSRALAVPQTVEPQCTPNPRRGRRRQFSLCAPAPCARLPSWCPSSRGAPDRARPARPAPSGWRFRLHRAPPEPLTPSSSCSSIDGVRRRRGPPSCSYKLRDGGSIRRTLCATCRSSEGAAQRCAPPCNRPGYTCGHRGQRCVICPAPSSVAGVSGTCGTVSCEGWK